jgi:ketosteroid isomerase-like protein
MQDIRRAIENANRAFSEAFAKGDAAAVAGMYAASAKVFPPHAAIVEGSQAIEQFWKSVMVAGVKRVELQTTETECHGDTVIESGNATIGGRMGVFWTAANIS